MKTPALIEWRITVPVEDEVLIGELVEQLTGMTPVVQQEPETEHVTMLLYGSAVDVDATRTALELVNRIYLLGAEHRTPLPIQQRLLPHENWAESWKAHFEPLLIADRLWIRAAFHRLQPPPGVIELVITPGLSFGTGHHPTTRYCLEELVRLASTGSKQPPALLDAGTGSGILAIAAARLGFAPVVAVDIEETAIHTAMENAELNGVLDQIRFLQADVLQTNEVGSSCYDVICANLTADLIINGSAVLLSLLHRGGRLVVAGVLEEQFPTVEEALRTIQPIELERVQIDHPWVGATFKIMD